MTNQLRDHTPDTATIDRLSTGFNRCFVDFEVDDELRARHAAEAPMVRP